MMPIFGVAGVCVFTLVLFMIFRALYLLFKIFSSDNSLEKKSCNTLRTIICIGSGGHTSEILRITTSLNCDKYRPRLYITAENDTSSEVKIHQIERSLKNNDYKINKIPRSRNVHQSYISSISTTLHATICSVPVIYKFKPDVIICNGPGTCIPICIISFLFRCAFLLDCRIIFIESICRVRTLSLTGKILQYFADDIIVQWPQLRDACVRGQYFGRLT